MKEIVLNRRKNGLAVLMLTVFVYAAAILGAVFGGIQVEQGRSPLLMTVSIIILCIGWLPLLGLKVLKPQEALVLTLFGKYIGTLKDSGFYFVNPFCVAVNPAARTKLNQSGDVKNMRAGNPDSGAAVSVESTSKKISLKIMTLSNNRQKINDCLGNPVEIGIAVTWRIVDTAKAVFNVDNYKEFLSLQCDSA
ncbi:MAG TPA: hypothetical protein DD414_09155, partial [Lachnospiraceae bacterium]|nr:hypothetical protein [Lachnospiraceae bacterium]